MKTRKDNGHHTDVTNNHKNHEHANSNVKSRYFGNHDTNTHSCNSKCEESCTCTCNNCDCKAECPENCCG